MRAWPQVPGCACLAHPGVSLHLLSRDWLCRARDPPWLDSPSLPPSLPLLTGDRTGLSQPSSGCKERKTGLEGGTESPPPPRLSGESGLVSVTRSCQQLSPFLPYQYSGPGRRDPPSRKFQFGITSLKTLYSLTPVYFSYGTCNYCLTLYFIFV